MLSIISPVGMTVFGRNGSPLSDAAREFERSDPQQFDRIAQSDSFPGQEIFQQALADLRAKSEDYLRKSCAELNAIEGIHKEHNVARGNEYHFWPHKQRQACLLPASLLNSVRSAIRRVDL